MSIETQEQLDGMRAAGAVVARALAGMPRAAHPGVSTAELDAVAATVFRDAGARSGPQLDYDFPGVTCISVNNEAIHGIPGPRPLRSGDLVKLDVTAELNGFYADAWGGTVDAGYNGFSNAQHTNYLGMSAPTTDLNGGASTDPMFQGPLPTTTFDMDKVDVWNRTLPVSQILSTYRDRYLPRAGSPYIDAGDPSAGQCSAGQPCNDIGAVGAGNSSPLNKFGAFGA